MKIIGISAFAARSGKDTLAQCLQIVLTEKGKSATIKSLASPLKEKMKNFIDSEFGIDIFNCSDKEKCLIRPLLVAYGGARRKQTEGQYWTRLMDQEIAKLENEDVDYLIVPDIRYAEYDGDEVSWLKSKNGTLFFVSLLLENGEKLLPPNEDEERNGPILEKNSDIKINWSHMSFDDCLKFVRNNFSVYEKYL